MPAQPEIEAYLNFVADRLDLRRDIQFDTKVVAMTFDEDAGGLDGAHRSRRDVPGPVRRRRLRHPVGAAGTRHPRMDSFAGTSLYTSRWPKEGFDLAGKRVGVIGTGSTGVQLIPVVAREAAAALRVSAFTGVYPAVAGAPVRARRAGRDEGPLRRNPRRPTGAPGRRGAAERLLGAARDARQAAVEDGDARRAIARHRGDTA